MLVHSQSDSNKFVLWAGVLLFTLVLGAALLTSIVWAYPFDPLPAQPGFEGGKVLSGAAVNYSSPVLADLNGDGTLEIIFGGRDGMVYAVDANGALPWQFDAAAAVNAIAPLPSQSVIDSAPAVGDLDGDGQPEVVVSVGAPASLTGYNGGVIVLTHDGTLRAGWPQLSLDNNGDGYMEGFYSSPALGDLDGDGNLEIVAGSWDMRVYAWHHDGQLVDGWPRFAFDTVWSSPALADLDRDGRVEVIIGVDAHTPDGGYLHVYRADGSEMAGFPKHIDQTIFSSPAVGDLNGDGWLDIVVGTGNFYAGKGHAIYAWDYAGNPLSGWPVATSGYVLSSPSVGDIDDDGLPEVVVGCNDGRIYAVNGDGSFLAGWPVTVQDNLGNTGPLNFSSPVLANFDADVLPEIFVNHYCDTVVLDGDGTQLTHVGDSAPSGKPNMYMFNAWCLGTTPAAGDIDLDGKLEIVRAGGDDPAGGGGNALLYVWESDRTPATAPWPMFRRDRMHHALYQPTPAADARIVSHTLPALMVPGESWQAQITVENTGSDSWTESGFYRLGTASDDPLAPNTRVYLDPGESVAPGQQRTFAVTLQAPATPGYYATRWRMLQEGVGWFGLSASRRVKVGNEPAFYVLSKEGGGPGGGGVYAGGLAADLTPPAGYTNWPAVKAFGFLQDYQGYQMLDDRGGVWQGGTAQPIGGHGFVPEAQAILLRRDGTSYYILDKYGQLTCSYGAYPISPPPPTFTDPIARSAALTPDERGIYVLDGYGNVYTGGNAPTLTPATPYFGVDIAKRIKLTADGTGYYVLDAYGRVWNGGAALTIAPNYAFRIGEDWARDFELTADGQGYYLLDKEGYIYTGGTAVTPTVDLPSVWPGQDVAVDLAVADSRVLNAPVLLVVPDALTFITTPDLPRSLTVQVSNVGGGTLNWSAETDRDWLTVSPGSGSAPATLTVSVSPANLEIGTYEGNVIVRSQDAANSPISVYVRLLVVETVYPVYLPLVSR